MLRIPTVIKSWFLFAEQLPLQFVSFCSCFIISNKKKISHTFNTVQKSPMLNVKVYCLQVLFLYIYRILFNWAFCPCSKRILFPLVPITHYSFLSAFSTFMSTLPPKVHLWWCKYSQGHTVFCAMLLTSFWVSTTGRVVRIHISTNCILKSI